MTPGIYVDPAEYYEAFAEYCAKWQINDAQRIMRGLFDLPESVLEDIDSNPHEFNRRVAEYAYGMAMEGKDHE